MPAKKMSVKETTPTTPLVGGEHGNGIPNGGEEQKPPPTFEEMWFDDPIEGREAQRLALQIRKNVVLRAEPMRIYLAK
jgi:protein dpy-30